MISIETRVNGVLLGYIYARNAKEVDEAKGIYTYEVEFYKPEGKPPLMEFSVRHKRDEGFEKLALIVYKEVNRRIKERKGEKNG